MAERRRSHLREPIEVEVQSGEVWYAKPLPWLDRNSLGDAIVEQHAIAVNEMLKIYVTDLDGAQIPQIEALARNKIRDWTPLLKIAYPDSKVEDFQALTFEDCVELVLASMDINILSELKDLVDPNSSSQTPGGGLDVLGLLGLNGQNPVSSPGSATPDTVEPTSSISPTPSSETSSPT